MKPLRSFLIVALLTVAAVEVFLRVFDPWGARYYDNVQQLWEATAPDPSGYTFRPGVHPFGLSTFTIEADGTRRVPGSVDGGRRVAFVGDSVTFGQGVNDDETWVSLVCAELTLDCTNYGRSSYQVPNILELVRTLDGCVVWYTIPNDTGARMHQPTPNYAYVPYSAYYLRAVLGTVPSAYPYVEDVHTPMYAMLANRPDMLVLASRGDQYGERMRDQFGAVLIAGHTVGISRIDGHANAEGNRQIADAAAPVIADWLEGRDCS
jgi:hypothetical protein